PQAQSQTSPADSASDAVPALKASNTNIWQNGTGERIKPRTQSISFNADAGYGVGISDGKQSQYLALAGISDGYRPGSVEGEGPDILTLRAEGPDELALKRVTLKGPVVALV